MRGLCFFLQMSASRNERRVQSCVGGGYWVPAFAGMTVVVVGTSMIDASLLPAASSAASANGHDTALIAEARLGDADHAGDEKDARTLGTLTRTLDMLMALERDNGTTADKPEAVNRDELNAELSRRITRWAEGGDGHQ